MGVCRIALPLPHRGKNVPVSCSANSSWNKRLQPLKLISFNGLTSVTHWRGSLVDVLVCCRNSNIHSSLISASRYYTIWLAISGHIQTTDWVLGGQCRKSVCRSSRQWAFGLGPSKGVTHHVENSWKLPKEDLTTPGISCLFARLFHFVSYLAPMPDTETCAKHISWVEMVYFQHRNRPFAAWVDWLCSFGLVAWWTSRFCPVWTADAEDWRTRVARRFHAREEGCSLQSHLERSVPIMISRTLLGL